MKKPSFDDIVQAVVKRRKRVERVFLVLTLLCAICFPFVGVNYDLSEYLPDFAPTRQALNVMEAEFGYPAWPGSWSKTFPYRKPKTSGTA